jgi:8-oxo-dGTP diphosphatase
MIKVTAAIIEKDSRILIAKRKTRKDRRGAWEFPGGKVEEGETPEEAIEREILEEFETKIKCGDFFMSVPFTIKGEPAELLVYKALHVDGDFEPLDHEEVKWVLPSGLGMHKFLEADEKVVEEIRKRR